MKRRHMKVFGFVKQEDEILEAGVPAFIMELMI
jgi:hypothetical protein